MPKPRPQIWILLAVVLALGGSYAMAQQPQGSAPKPAAGAAPKDAAHKGHEAMPEGHEGMHGGMHEGHEGMHGGMHEGHEGMHEEMEGHGCPLEQAGPIASVKVEKTDTGAVIRLTAKNPTDVQKLQHMAEMMAEHMGAAAGPHKEMGPGAAAGAHKEAGPGAGAPQHKDAAPKKEAAPAATKPAK
jgi:hypothetical protein